MIELVRNNLKDAWSSTGSAHPGLLIQRGLVQAGGAGETVKAKHVERICKSRVDGYKSAYERWTQATGDERRFRRLVLQIEGRLLIGLNGGGALETGCTVQHTWGMPMIPGSSIKGVVRAAANHAKLNNDDLRELCGDDSESGSNLSGVVAFHDAWWVPESAPKPFTQDVVTVHHPDYYSTQGEKAATDLDSPIPNPLIGVHGSFLFPFGGAPEWTALAEQLLRHAAEEFGIGAKTRAGYGRLVKNEKWEADQKAKAERADTLRKQLEQEAAERNKREALAEESRQRAAALTSLSPERRAVSLALEALEAFLQRPEAVRTATEETLRIIFKPISESAHSWPDAADRNEAADLLARLYDTLGWHEKGVNKEKREKQTRKKQERISAIRAGSGCEI